MFVTKVEIKPFTNPIDYNDRILLLGSCFAENIGKLLSENKFPITLNPYGILFNPESIARSIELALEGKQYDTSDLFLHQGIYHAFDFHSRYSRETAEEALSVMNGQAQLAQKALYETNTLVVTFGSTFVYRKQTDGAVVANCHKMPEQTFRRDRLTVGEIVDRWLKLLEQLPQLKQIIFSVSPVRHLRDGMHENQLSKATLLLAIDEIIRSDRRSTYFPAYELVQDELRDYRYYDADMSHPSTVAINYIRQRFKEVAIHPTAYPLMQQCEQIQRDISHRPIAPQSETYRLFLQHIHDRITTILRTHPQLNFTSELQDIDRVKQGELSVINNE